MNIHLLHTNDVHSQLENYMRLGAAVRELRDDAGRRGDWVLTFDIGDALDRVRPETEATMGRLNAALMGALGCDGWVFGNNEGLTVASSVWPKLAELAQTPILCANVRQLDGSLFPFVQESLIFEQRGVRVGVFGLTPNYDRPYAVLGVQTSDPLARAKHVVADLRQADCDVVVALSHLGLQADMDLAAVVPGIDVILGGHTHQFMTEGIRVGNTAIFQPGKHGMVFGHTTVDYDDIHRCVRSVTSRPVPVDVHGKFDQQMLSVYRGYQPGVEAVLGETVAHLDKPLTVQFNQESVFPNLLVDVLFDHYPCDIGLMMAGALTASLMTGDVSYEHVLGACTTPTRPLLMSLQGSDLQRIVEQSIQPEYYDRPGFGFGFRGAVVGYLALANARATLRYSADGRRCLDTLQIGGQLLEPSRWYRVVTCEYLWLSPVFPDFRRGRDVEFKAPLVRDLLLSSMHDVERLDAAAHNRYAELQ